MTLSEATGVQPSCTDRANTCSLQVNTFLAARRRVLCVFVCVFPRLRVCWFGSAVLKEASDRLVFVVWTGLSPSTFQLAGFA